MLTLTNSAGAHWDSGWEDSRLLLFPDENPVGIDFSLNKDEFARMEAAPVHIHLLLAFTLFRDRNQRQVVVPRGEFGVPDLGFCTAVMQAMSPLVCRKPLSMAEPLLIRADWAASTCPHSKDEPLPASGANAQALIHPSTPVEMGISPVESSQSICMA